MQTFFELDELQPVDREWTNKNGNGQGAGTLSASGTFVWASAANEKHNTEVTAVKDSDTKAVDARSDEADAAAPVHQKAKMAAVSAADGGGVVVGEEDALEDKGRGRMITFCVPLLLGCWLTVGNICKAKLWPRESSKTGGGIDVYARVSRCLGQSRHACEWVD